MKNAMKYFATFLLLCTLANVSSAQIRFTADEYFAGFSQTSSSGTSYSSTDLTGLAALIAKSGAGMSWDLGNRAYSTNSTYAGTQTVLTYPGGAALADDADFLVSTHVLKSVPNDPTQPTAYLFIKFNQTGLWFVGFSQDSMGVTKKLAAYVPPMQQIGFPLTYQTAWQSNSDIHSPSLPQGASFSTAIDAVADAYGTLITPTSAHKKADGTPMAAGDAIRVKTKTTNTTSITIPGFGTITTVTVDYSFQWYTKTGHSATISADTNVTPTGASYSVEGSSSVFDNYSYSSPENILNLYLSANPASNSETKFFYTMPKDGNAQVSLMDPLGREIHMLQNGHASAGQNIIPIDVSKLSSGTYFIRVNTDGMTATRKLIITK
jgi:hypothetical protein